jgi:murein DD-endopeptidase MepM/ murein hydrolase activator NlpD
MKINFAYRFLAAALLFTGCKPALKVDNAPVPQLHRKTPPALVQKKIGGVGKPEVDRADGIVGVFSDPLPSEVEQAIRIFQLNRSKQGPARDTAWYPFLETLFAYLDLPAKKTAFSPLIRARVAAEFELDADRRSPGGANPEIKKTVVRLLESIDSRMREIHALRRVQEYDPLPDGNGPCWPLSYGMITSGFGERKDPINGSITRFHAGLDLAAAPNEPVHATLGGIVTEARRSGNWGRVVRIRHSAGVETLYAHLATILVKEDQRITRGEVIGLLGKSGRTTGYHLHFGVYIDGKPVDPLERLPAIPMSFSDQVPGATFGYTD